MELSQIYLNTKYMIIYIYIYMYVYMYVFEWDIFFGLNYDLIYMISDNLTMFDSDT